MFRRRFWIFVVAIFTVAIPVLFANIEPATLTFSPISEDHYVLPDFSIDAPKISASKKKSSFNVTSDIVSRLNAARLISTSA